MIIENKSYFFLSTIIVIFMYNVVTDEQDATAQENNETKI